MNILLASNEKYLKYASVLVASIFENNKNHEIEIYYIYSDVESKYKDILEKQVKECGGNIHFFPFPEEYVKEAVTNQYFSKEVYSTLFPHLYLPKELDRVLYLDIDTIVNADISEFYKTDFEDNYLVAASNKPEFWDVTSFEEKRMRKGEYFNSGVVLFNLEKLRKNVTIDFYKEVLVNSQDYFFDQGMLNWLYCKQTKYVDPILFNFRHTIARKTTADMNKEGAKQIIHYLSTAQPYKPWDLMFTSEELANISMLDYVKEKNVFFVDELSNSLNVLWWEYAKKSPCYEELFNAMMIKKEYLTRFSLWDKINANTTKLVEYKKRIGYEIEKDTQLKKYQKKKDVLDSFLAAGNKYIEKDDELIKITDVNQYFEVLRERPELVLICACKDTCAKYFQQFCDAAKTNEWKKAEFRESYVVLYSGGDTLHCEKNAKEIRYDTVIYRNEIDDLGIMSGENFQISVISKGFVPDTQISVARIMVNNYEYSFNGLGLNGVCIDRNKMKVVDSWNVNMHKDAKLKIVRKK